MQKLSIVIPFLTFVITGSSLASDAGVLPVGQPEYEFIYDRMDRLAAGSLDKSDYQLGPYRFDLLPSDLSPFNRFREVNGTRVTLFGFPAEDMRSARYARATAFESIRGGLAARPTNNLFVYAHLALDEKRANDPNYTGIKWRGLAGDVEQAFVYYQAKSFGAQAGRFSSFWGVRNSMILGSNAIMDGFAYTLRFGRVAFSYRFAKLDGLSPDRNDVAAFENRYLAGHRVDVHLSSRFRVGISEMVVWGGPGRTLDFAYLNPLLFYHSSQLNDNADDNTLFGFDFDLKPYRKVHVYGQLLVDDYQIEKNRQSDQEPNEYGFILGSYIADVLPEWDVKAEYSRVTNWTYNQPKPRNRYLFDGKPISAALGNDYDLVDLSLIRWVDNNLRTSVNIKYFRQGEGSPKAAWTQPWMQVTGDYSEPFPTGVVERTFTVSAGLKGFVKGLLFVDAEGGVQGIRSYAHVCGDNRTVPFFRLMLSAFLSTNLDLR